MCWRALSYARLELRWNQIVAAISGGRTSDVASASCQSMSTSATATPISVIAVDQRGDEPGLEELRERVDVGRHAGHDAAGHLALEVVDAEPLQVGEELDPEREEHPLGRAAHRPGSAPTSPTSRRATIDEERDRRGPQRARSRPSPTPSLMPNRISHGPASVASASSATRTSPATSGQRNGRRNRRNRNGVSSRVCAATSTSGSSTAGAAARPAP